MDEQAGFLAQLEALFSRFVVGPVEAVIFLGLAFWNAAERALRECWEDAPGMNAFRGESWMREPCRSCPERARDFGGCRCQAFALTGDPANTDPACALAPEHHRVLAALEGAGEGPLRYRGDTA